MTCATMNAFALPSSAAPNTSSTTSCRGASSRHAFWLAVRGGAASYALAHAAADGAAALLATVLGGAGFGGVVVDGAVALALMAAALAVLPRRSCPLTIVACPCLPVNPHVGASVRLLQTAGAVGAAGAAGTTVTFLPRPRPSEAPRCRTARRRRRRRRGCHPRLASPLTCRRPTSMARCFLLTRTRLRLAVRGGAAPDALARAVADGAAALLAVLRGAGFGVVLLVVTFLLLGCFHHHPRVPQSKLWSTVFGRSPRLRKHHAG